MVVLWYLNSHYILEAIVSHFVELLNTYWV